MIALKINYVFGIFIESLKKHFGTASPTRITGDSTFSATSIVMVQQFWGEYGWDEWKFLTV